MGKRIKIRIELFPLVNGPAPSGRPAPGQVPEDEQTGFPGMIAASILPVFNLLGDCFTVIGGTVLQIIEIMIIPFQRIYGIMNNRAGEEDDPGKDEERPPRPGGESRE